MRIENTVTLRGNLTHDLEFKTYNGRSFISFQIAVSKTWIDKDGNQKENTSFLPIVAWGKIADDMQPLRCTKGTSLTLMGELNSSSWESDGKRKSRVFVKANFIVQTQKEEPAKPLELPTPELIDPEDIPF